MVTDVLDTARVATRVHPTAIVEEGARVGDACVIHAHAFIGRHCHLEAGVVVHPYAVIGGDPQDLSFDPNTHSTVRIGARTVLREHVTINRATRRGAVTAVGSDCFLMAASHVAHDCVVGDRVVLANATLLGGHVQVGDFAFVGGGAVVHQFCRIGESVMIGGGARISGDVPPYLLAAERNSIYGLNMVGLRRRRIPRDALREIKEIYRRMDGGIGRLREFATQSLADNRYTTPEARTLLRFLADGRRAFARKRRDAGSNAADEIG